MKYFPLGTAVVGLIMTGMLGASPLTINFASDTNAVLSFDGAGDFQFLNTAGTNCDPSTNASCTAYDFTLSSPTLTSLDGLQADVTGVYAIGSPITTSGALQSAPASGSGKLVINDGSGNFFTADLSFVKIATFFTGTSYVGFGGVLVSNYSYSGTNTGLEALAASPFPTALLTLASGAPNSLTSLATVAQQTSYSGKITSTPEPVSTGLVGAGLVGLVLAFRRRKNPTA
jgi:hypothetical protein